MNVIIKRSKLSGKGVFADKNFQKGETVIPWNKSRKIRRSQIPKLSKHDQNHLNYIGNGSYAVMRSPEKYVNHSCNPNTYVRNEKDIAIRNIKIGEEITTDYSANSMEDWILKCQCKSKSCRKMVCGDFRKLDMKTKKRLNPYIQEWLKKELKK